jgi:hypothetical protein
MDEQKMKEFACHVQEALAALDSLTEDDIARINAATSGPVDLRDTGRFNLSLDMITRGEISQHRRKLAAAIAAEKVFEGFKLAVQIMMMFGGI